MEGMRYRVGTARAVLVRVAAMATVALIAACSSATPRTVTTPIPTLVSFNANSLDATLAPGPTNQAIASSSTDLPESPTTTSALALTKASRGSSVPVGAVVFGSDVSAAAKAVSVVGERTSFPVGHAIAWRVTLPAATGGESVRVTLTTADNTETQVDAFVAQAGWNVYYGKSLLTVAPGTYVLHYLVDGHEVGSGTFKIKAADPVVPAPTAAASVAAETLAPAAATATNTPTPQATDTPTPQPAATTAPQTTTPST